MMENKLEVHKDKTLKEAVEMAYKVSGWLDLILVPPKLYSWNRWFKYLEVNCSSSSVLQLFFELYSVDFEN